MIEFYFEIRLIHITAVIASGGLFLLRGIALFAGAGWTKARLVRYLSYTIDTVLLTAALLLSLILRQYPFVHAWLTAKIILLVIYILLGFYAFWRAPTRLQSLGYWLAAMGVYTLIFSVARAHHPLGIFSDAFKSF